MIALTIILSILSVVCLILTVVLAMDENQWCFLTVVGFAGSLLLTVSVLIWGSDKSESDISIHTIHEVKSVQIDTVITTCKNASNLQEFTDTTYVIKYTK